MKFFIGIVILFMFLVSSMVLGDSENGSLMVRAISSRAFPIAISYGEIANHKIFSLLGRTTTTGTTQITMWSPATQYTFPSAAQKMELVSTDAADAVAGTGARSVRLIYLDADGKEGQEVINLNGTTVVTTVTSNIFRINSFRTATVGSLGTTKGTVNIRALGAGTIFSQIPPAENVAEMGVTTVPTGKVLFVSSFSGSCVGSTANKSARMTLRATYDIMSDQQLTPGLHFMPVVDSYLTNDVIARPFDEPLRIPAGTDIKINLQGDSGVSCACIVRGWMASNPS
jgi:hypothetical protein